MKGILRVLLLRLLMLMFMFSVCRVLFLCENTSYYSSNTISEFILSFLYGLRFDLSAILTINSLTLLLAIVLLGLKLWNHRYSLVLQKQIQKVDWLQFNLINSVAILLSFIDIFYFKYILKHSGIGLLYIFKTGDDVLGLVSSAFKQYWWGLILLIVLIWFIYKFLRKFGTYEVTINSKISNQWSFPIAVFGIICCSVIGIRGGFQLRPIEMVSAQYGNNIYNSQLILNAPYCIIQGMLLPSIDLKEHMSDAEAIKIYNPVQNYQVHSGTIHKKNICLIVVESFSWELCRMGKSPVSVTPFIDSLMNYSTVYTRMYANGKSSIDGIPAIISGLPALLKESFLTSAYSGNQIGGLGYQLKNKGYQTSFYHGGKKGTMNFDTYSSMAGFENYFGKEQYNNQVDFDGNWGIKDLPYLKYYSEMLGQQKQPFFSTLFTLSSHPPYYLDDADRKIHQISDNPFLNSMHYTDSALRVFFQMASKQSWFNNTIFYITADHTGEQVWNHSREESYHIPLIIYNPDDKIGKTYNHLVQQIDIPTIISDELNVPRMPIRWGNREQTIPFSISFNGEDYQLITDSAVLHSNGTSVASYTMVNGASIKYSKNQLLLFLQSYIQQYNKRMFYNRMIIP